MAAYARRQYAGGAVSTTVPLQVGISDGSFTLASATNWPDGSTGNFTVIIDAATPEKITCATRTGLVVTVASSGRGADGTSASGHPAGSTIQCVHSAQDDDEANQVVNAVLGQANAAKGDLLAMLSAAGPNTLTRVGIGVVGQQLGVASGLPAWQYPWVGSLITGSTSLAIGNAYGVTSGSFTATLPAPVRGGSVQLTNYGSGAVVLAQHSAEKIFGVTCGASGVSSNAVAPLGGTVTVTSLDGVSWWVTAGSFTTNATVTGGAGTASSSASFAALTTPAAVTITTGTNIKVTVTGNIQSAGNGGVGYLGFAISGATTLAASTANALWYLAPAANEQAQMSFVMPVTVTAGSNSIALQYRGDGANNCTITDAMLMVDCLN